MKILDSLQDKIPPHDLALERTVIGASLLDSKVTPPLLPEEFFLDRHRVIWTAMRELYESDGAFDLRSVVGHLAAKGKLSDAGGPAHIGLCVEEGCLSIQVNIYARMIRDHARQRQIIALGAELIGKGYNGEISEAEIARRIDELPGPLTSAIYDPALNWNSIVGRWGEKRILSGYSGLDTITGGHGQGELILIAGRPSHGKTAFSTNLARRIAGQGTEVDYLTLEETADAITRNWISQISGVPGYRIKEGTLTPSEIEACEAAVVQIQELPLTCTSLETINSLDEDAVVGMAARSKGRVLFVDHCQKVNTRGDSRVYGLESLLNRLHAVAIRNKITIIVLWQLRRDMDKDNRPPQLSDLRDSGAAEMAPRQILLLYWPWKSKPDDNPQSYYRVDVAKNSHAGTAVHDMSYDPVCGRFDDSVNPNQPEPF